MRSTKDTFQFGPECIARGFLTIFIMREEGVKLIKTSGIDIKTSGIDPLRFIMREEGVKLIKTSGIDPLRYYDIFDNF